MRQPRYQKCLAFLARAPASLLHWLCCGFVGIYVLTNQYFYAVSDKLCFVNHDWWILSPTFENYNAGPAGYVLSTIKNLALRPGFHYGFSNFILAANFLVFGRTLFVYKMTMAAPLLCLALAAYWLAYSVTKKELAGLLSAIAVCDMQIVVIDSRTQFPFIALTAALLLACLAAIDNLDLRDGRRLVVFAACFWACVLIHPSAFLFCPFIFAYLFFSNRNRARYAALLLLFLLTAAWCRPAVTAWMANKQGGASLQNAASNIWRHIRAADFPFTVQSLDPAFGGTGLFRLFLFNCGLFYSLRFAFRRFAAGVAGEAAAKIDFLFLFMLYVLSVAYVVRAGGAWEMPQDTVLIFHALCAILLVSMLFLMGRTRLGRWPIPWLYAALCALPVIKAAEYNYFLIPAEPLKVVGHSYDERTFIEDDLADISELLSCLQKENRRLTGNPELGVFKYSVTLRDGEHGVMIGPPAQLSKLWPRYDDFPVLISHQAFFNGIEMKWDNIADGDEPRRPDYRFLFLIVGQEAGADLWTMPDRGLVLAK